MSALIGELAPERLTCDSQHRPGCFNPQPAPNGSTACICGERWWAGHVGVWHSRQLREPDVVPDVGRPQSGAVIGWDVYFMHAEGCGNTQRNPSSSHTCGSVAGVSAVEFWGLAS